MTEPASVISLDWPSDTDVRQVGTLVLGGVAARTDAPVDRVEELGFALDSLARRVTEPRAALEITADAESLKVAIGPFETDPLADEGVGRVVRAFADEATGESREGAYWVTLAVLLRRG